MLLRTHFSLRSAFGVAMVFAAVGCASKKDTGGGTELTTDTGTSGSDGFSIDAEGDGPSEGGGLEGLDITPSNGVVVIDTTTSPAMPGVLTYKALATKSDGSTEDV